MQTSRSAGLYKITIDTCGHITNVATATKSDIGLEKAEKTAGSEKTVKHAQTVEKVTQTALKNGLGFVPYKTTAYFEKDGKLEGSKDIPISETGLNFSLRIGYTSVNGVNYYGIFLIHPVRVSYTMNCSYTITLPNQNPQIEVGSIFTWSSGITPLYYLTVSEFEKYKYMGFDFFIHIDTWFAVKLKGYYNPTEGGNYFELTVFDE